MSPHERNVTSRLHSQRRDLHQLHPLAVGRGGGGAALVLHPHQLSGDDDDDDDDYCDDDDDDNCIQGEHVNGEGNYGFCQDTCRAPESLFVSLSLVSNYGWIIYFYLGKD